MKVFIGILIGISLMFAFQKLMKEKDRPVEQVVTTPLQTDAATAIPPDFMVFYSQFHSDSIYQMKHINFPLEGFPAYADSLTVLEKTFRWQEEDWRMHRNMEERKQDFHKNLVQVSDGLIFEYIPTGDNKLWMERRFLKTGNEWRLIYFSDLNLRNND